MQKVLLGKALDLEAEAAGLCHVLAVVNSAAVNIGMHVSFQIIVLSRYMLRSGIAGSYGNSSVLRNHHAILHSRRHNLHSHEQFTVHS